MPKTQAPARGYTATKDQLLARLRRIEGQIRGIEGMVQDDRYCIDILTQISAAQAALDKVALGLLDGHAHTCVIGAEPDQQDARDRRDDGRRRPTPQTRLIRPPANGQSPPVLTPRPRRQISSTARS